MHAARLWAPSPCVPLGRMTASRAPTIRGASRSKRPARAPAVRGAPRHGRPTGAHPTWAAATCGSIGAGPLHLVARREPAVQPWTALPPPLLPGHRHLLLADGLVAACVHVGAED